MIASVHHMAAVHVGVQSAGIPRASGLELAAAAAAYTGWEALVVSKPGCCLRRILRARRLEQ